MAGFIVLHRQIADWEWYDDPVVFKLFVHLLIKASWEDKKWHGMTIERGSLVTSLSHLAAEAGLSVRNVRTALSKLEQTGEISVEATQSFTIVKVLNYAKYQDYENDERQTADTLPTNERQTADTLPTTSNNNNHITNITNNTLSYSMPIPTAEEVKKYADAIGFKSLNAQAFIDYYSQRGWKDVYDWMAAVRQWQRREAEKPKQQNHSQITMPLPAYAEKQKAEGLPAESKASEEKRERIKQMQERMKQQ